MTFDLSATEKSAEVRCVYVRLRDDDGPCTVPVCIDDNGTFAVRNSYGRKSRGKSSLPIKGRARFTSRFTGKTSCFATGDDRTGSNSSANRFDSARERSSGCYRAAHTTEPVRESARRPPRRPGGDVSLRRPPRFSFILGCTVTLFVINLPSLVPTSSPETPRLKLLVIVMSSVKNQYHRDTIRKTWAQNDENVRTLFVTSRDQFLNAEKLIHDDLLEVDVLDKYQLLGHKLLETFKTVSNVSFDYLLKCDDDSFVNIPKVVDELERAPKNKFYWGYFVGNTPIEEGGKLKETDFKLCDKYLPYALGGGYVLSKDLISYIVRNRNYLSVFVCEDISVGVWLAPLNITRKHDQRFDSEHRTRGCQNDHLVTHKHSPEIIILYWSRLVNTGEMCNVQYFDFMPYEYDWTAMPSKCCEINSSFNLNNKHFTIRDK